MEVSAKRPKNGKNYDYMFKIILVGDSGVGKTSILSAYVGEEVSRSHISTIGIDFKMKNMTLDGHRVKVQIWDTAGQERYETITTQYYRRAHGIILAYDVTSRHSFNNVRKWLRYVEQYAEQNVRLSIVANKIDLCDEREVSSEEAERIAEEFNVPWFETSAFTGEHIEDAFNVMAKQIYVDVIQQARDQQQQEQQEHDSTRMTSISLSDDRPEGSGRTQGKNHAGNKKENCCWQLL